MRGRLGHHDTQQKLTDCSHCQLSSQIIRVHYLVWDLVLAALSCPYTNPQQPHGKGIFAGCRFHQDWNTLDDTNNSHREQSTEKKSEIKSHIVTMLDNRNRGYFALSNDSSKIAAIKLTTPRPHATAFRPANDLLNPCETIFAAISEVVPWKSHPPL